MSNAIGALTDALADRYRIERELGAGGMATVYLARDLRHDRDVAIKVLRPELAAVIGADRFLAEIKTTANLQHPHILPLHDSGEVNGTVYYVMPFVQGESLRERLEREKQLPVGEAVRIATEVASALDYAHRHGVIHRDIKPENILLHDRQALVADFGIALAVSRSDGGTRMTETGMSLGTPHYMSPEQAMGERTLDARADIYALGCVTYEMLVGEPPFSGPTAQAIVAKVMTVTPEPITTFRKTVPLAVEDAVRTALQKLPADRFATAAEFARGLATPDDSRARTTLMPAPRSRRDRSLLLGITALAAALLLIAIVGWSRYLTAGDSREPLAYEIHLTPSESEVGFVATQLAMSSDGRVLVYSDTVGGVRQLWVKERGNAEARPIPGSQGGQSPFLAPDGRTVAFTNEAHLFRIPIGGGVARLLSDSAQFEGWETRGTWLEDGTIVFFGGNSFLYAVPDTGGTPRRIATADQLLGFPIVIAAVPGHDVLLVTSCDIDICTNAVVNLVHMGSSTVEQILPGSSGAWALRNGRLLNSIPDGTLYLANFDPATGRVGEGVPVASGVVLAERGPELSVGVDGAVIQGVGDVGRFTNRAQLVLAGLDGSTRVIDSAWSSVFANNSRIELSPDGRRLLLSQVDANGVEASIFVKPYPVGRATLFSSIGRQSSRGVWSPDGRRVAWVVVGADGKASIWQQSADGSGSPAQLLDDPRGLFEIGYSPDGNWLVYRTDDVAAGSGDIYARRTSGDTSTVTIAATVAEETSPTISPDGRWVAYAERIGAIKEVIVRPFPNVDAGRVQVSNGGGTEPLWSHDGRTLYYRVPLRGQIVAATMDAGGEFPADGRRTVFRSTRSDYWENDDSRQYALMPDGTGFLLMRRIRAEVAATPMRLLLREHFVPDR